MPEKTLLWRYPVLSVVFVALYWATACWIGFTPRVSQERGCAFSISELNLHPELFVDGTTIWLHADGTYFSTVDCEQSGVVIRGDPHVAVWVQP